MIYPYKCEECLHQWEEETRDINAALSPCPRVDTCHGVGIRQIPLGTTFVVNGHNAKNGYSK